MFSQKKSHLRSNRQKGAALERRVKSSNSYNEEYTYVGKQTEDGSS